MVAWTGVKTRELEEMDNSGCVLNIKSTGLGDQLDLKSRQKKKTQRDQGQLRFWCTTLWSYLLGWQNPGKARLQWEIKSHALATLFLWCLQHACRDAKLAFRYVSSCRVYRGLEVNIQGLSESQIPLKDILLKCVTRWYASDSWLYLRKVQVEDIASALKILSLPWGKEADTQKNISYDLSVLGWMEVLWGANLCDLQPWPWALLVLSSVTQTGLVPPVLPTGQ